MKSRRNPSGHPKQIKTASAPRLARKSSDAEAVLLLLPNPLPAAPEGEELRKFFREFDEWLILLRRRFYDFIEGFLGPEGDPIRLSPLISSNPPRVIREESPELTPSELFDAIFVYVDGSKTSMDPAWTSELRAEKPVAKRSVSQLELLPR